MVTPGNPLKDHGALRPMDERLAMLRDLGLGPRDRATAFEAAHSIRYTADTLALLRRRRPDVAFVWIMGADSLATFHRWQDWRTIAQTCRSPWSTGPARPLRHSRRRWPAPSPVRACRRKGRGCCRS